MKIKRIGVALAGLGISAALLTGCGAAETPSAAKEQLNLAVELMSDTLDPAVNWDSWFLVRYGAGETLVRFAADGSYEPWLAEEWEVADDGLTWTFTLREGITFSTGEPVTASKVMESIERLYELEDPASGGTGNPQGHFTYSSISADDEARTVTIVTTQPVPDLVGCMAYPWMMIIDVAGSANRDIATQGPIGTGPYVITSFTQDNDVQLERNENYWDGDVPFETVSVMKSSEPSTRSMALQDGSADIALNISTEDLAVLESTGGYTIDVVTSTRTAYAHLNVDGVLGNEALRQAVLTAIDGSTIADVTTSGAYTHGPAVVPSSLEFGYDQLDKPFEYDPARAEQILDDAGIVDTDGDGYRELDGNTIDLDYKVTANRHMDKIAQAQAAQLDAVGIKATVQVVTTQAEIMQSGMFDLVSSNEVVTPTGDPAKFLGHWYTPSDLNYSNYSNPAYDEIYEELIIEFDAGKRKEYITELQQILLDDAAALVYGYFNYNIVSVDNIQGVDANPNDFYWVVKDITYSE